LKSKMGRHIEDGKREVDLCLLFYLYFPSFVVKLQFLFFHK
jgi:hypothetical protein